MCQNNGEYEQDYPVRLKILSLDVDLGGTGEAKKKHLSLALVFNGLRDVNLRRELMAEHSEDWNRFTKYSNPDSGEGGSENSSQRH